MTEPQDPAAQLSRRRMLVTTAMLAASTPAVAQMRAADWPNQTIRYINLYAPGGATDIASRACAARMSTVTGQQFVVEEPRRGGWHGRRHGHRPVGA